MILSALFSRWGLIAALSVACYGLWEWADHLDDELKAAEALNALWVREAKDAEAERATGLRDLQAKQTTATATVRDHHAAAVAALKGAASLELQLRETLHAAITPSADARCIVPRGAVLYHDGAAAGTDENRKIISGAAGGSVDTPSGVALSDLIGTVGDNYGNARSSFQTCLAEVVAWREWYPVQRALFETALSGGKQP